MATEITKLSRTATLGQEDTSVTYVYRVTPYSAHPTVASYLLGGVRLMGGRLVRIPPARDPYMHWCFCQSVKVDPDPGAAPYGETVSGLTVLRQAIDYPAAILTAMYKAYEPEFAPDNDANDGTNNTPQEPSDQQEIDLASLAIDFSARQLPLPGDRYAWEGEQGVSTDGALLLNEDVRPVKTFPGMQMTLVRHYCVNLPTLTIISMLGRINGRPFRIKKGKQRIVWPAETLRFDGGHATRKTSSYGLKFWDITYQFAVQPIYDYIIAPNDGSLDELKDGVREWVGWNRIFRPSTGTWQYVTTTGSFQRRIYDLDEDLKPDPRHGGELIPVSGSTRKGFKLLFDPRAT